MPMARMALRPSYTTGVGKPAVQSSTERPTTWSAPAWTPARSSSTDSGTPVQTALPTRLPPTRFDTHDRVMT